MSGLLALLVVGVYLVGVGVMAEEAQRRDFEMDDQVVALSWVIGFTLGFLWPPLVVACGVLALIGGSVVRRMGLDARRKAGKKGKGRQAA